MLTEAEILAIYKSAAEHIRHGKLLMSYTGEGTAANYQFTASALDIMREARTALKQKNPRKYGFIATEARIFFA
jgi:hypothetical protein